MDTADSQRYRGHVEDGTQTAGSRAAEQRLREARTGAACDKCHVRSEWSFVAASRPPRNHEGKNMPSGGTLSLLETKSSINHTGLHFAEVSFVYGVQQY